MMNALGAENYQLVQLANGAFSVRSLAEHETFHPVIGPVAEAEALYVNQLKLRERLEGHSGQFMVWDVGLGAGANVLTVLRATAGLDRSPRIISFDRTVEPLDFALRHAAQLGYFSGYERAVADLLRDGRALDGKWELRLGELSRIIAARVGGGAAAERDFV
jgi:hypothetical protein